MEYGIRFWLPREFYFDEMKYDVRNGGISTLEVSRNILKGSYSGSNIFDDSIYLFIEFFESFTKQLCFNFFLFW